MREAITGENCWGRDIGVIHRAGSDRSWRDFGFGSSNRRLLILGPQVACLFGPCSSIQNVADGLWTDIVLLRLHCYFAPKARDSVTVDFHGLLRCQQCPRMKPCGSTIQVIWIDVFAVHFLGFGSLMDDEQGLIDLYPSGIRRIYIRALVFHSPVFLIKRSENC